MSSPYINPTPHVSETLVSQFKPETMSNTYKEYTYKHLKPTVPNATGALGTTWEFDVDIATTTHVIWDKAQFVIKYKTLKYETAGGDAYNYLTGTSTAGATDGFAPGAFPEGQIQKASFSINSYPMYENTHPIEQAMVRAMVDGNALDARAFNGLMPYDGSGETAVDTRVADSTTDKMFVKRKNHLISTNSISIPVKNLFPCLASPEPYQRRGKHTFSLQYMSTHQYFLHIDGHTVMSLDYQIYMVIPQVKLSDSAEQKIIPYMASPVVMGYNDIDIAVHNIPVGETEFTFSRGARNVNKIAIYVPDLPHATTYVPNAKGYASNAISASGAEITNVHIECGEFSFDTGVLLRNAGDRALNSWMLTRDAQNPHIIPYVDEQTFRNMPILVIDLVKFGWDEKAYLLYGSGMFTITCTLSTATTTASTNINIAMFRSALSTVNEDGEIKKLE